VRLGDSGDERPDDGGHIDEHDADDAQMVDRAQVCGRFHCLVLHDDVGHLGRAMHALDAHELDVGGVRRTRDEHGLARDVLAGRAVFFKARKYVAHRGHDGVRVDDGDVHGRQQSHAAAALGAAGLHDGRGFGDAGIHERDADVRAGRHLDVAVTPERGIPAVHVVGGMRHELLREPEIVETRL